MSQAYSDPKRASDPHALPDLEVFYISEREARERQGIGVATDDGPDYETLTQTGWYWWACFPGCLPDSEPFGPFATEADALADAQSDGEV